MGGRIGALRRAQTRPTKQQNQIVAMCVAAEERHCTGGLRMIIQRACNENLPVLSAHWSFWILLVRSICVKVKLECRLQLGTLSVCCALLEVANTTKVHF